MVCAFRILLSELLQKLVALFAEATHGTHDKRNEISLHYMPTLSIFDGVRAALLLGRVLRELLERKQAKKDGLFKSKIKLKSILNMIIYVNSNICQFY